MSRVIKIGVLGCANIAKRSVLPAINQSSFFELTGVASRSKDKADSFASTFSTKAYYDYNALIKSDIDAIYIPLPNGLHYEWIKKALNSSLHVLVEKSLACNFVQVEELNVLAKDNGLVLMENFQFQFHNQLKFIRDQVDDGHLGKLKLVRSNFGFPPFEDKGNIRYQRAIGGGALLDAGAYTIKVSQIFLGAEIYVDSASLEIPYDQEVDISGSAVMKQINGNLISQVAFGFDHFYQNTLEVWGSDGKITASRIFTAGPGIQAAVKIERRGKPDKTVLIEDDHFINMLEHFSGLINSGLGLYAEYAENENQARLIGELHEKSQSF